MTPPNPAVVGFGFEVTLYVIFLVLFSLSVAYSFGWRRSRPVNIPITILTYTLFPICTAHLAVESTALFSDINEGLGMGFNFEVLVSFFIPFIIILIGDLVGDLLLLYRCWLIWDRRWTVIIVPAIGVIICLVFAVVAARFAQDPFGLVVYALPLVPHIVITTLISYRLYHLSAMRTPNTRKSSRQHHLWRMMLVVVESGLLVVIAQTVLVALSLSHSIWFDAAWFPIVQVYGIASMLIFLRTSWGAGEAAQTTRSPFPRILMRPTMDHSALHGRPSRTWRCEQWLSACGHHESFAYPDIIPWTSSVNVYFCRVLYSVYDPFAVL